MLERHITQARARALAETERAFNLVQTHVLETSTQLPAGVYLKNACMPVSAFLPINKLLYSLYCQFSFSQHWVSKLQTYVS